MTGGSFCWLTNCKEYHILDKVEMKDLVYEIQDATHLDQLPAYMRIVTKFTQSFGQWAS